MGAETEADRQGSEGIGSLNSYRLALADIAQNKQDRLRGDATSVEGKADIAMHLEK